MKFLLQIVGFASIIGGIIMFFVTLRAGSGGLTVDQPLYFMSAFVWILAGVGGAAIPLGLAEVIGRLERLETRL